MGFPLVKRSKDPVDPGGEERFLEQQRRKLAEIDVAIGRARLRQRAARDRGDDRTAEIEQGVIDRRLTERFSVKP